MSKLKKDFTKKDLSQYKTLKTIKERSEFLLGFQITARTNIVDLELVNQAYIGDLGLPIVGDYSDEEVIIKAAEWLTKKAEEKT